MVDSAEPMPTPRWVLEALVTGPEDPRYMRAVSEARHRLGMDGPKPPITRGKDTGEYDGALDMDLRTAISAIDMLIDRLRDITPALAGEEHEDARKAAWELTEARQTLLQRLQPTVTYPDPPSARFALRMALGTANAAIDRLRQDSAADAGTVADAMSLLNLIILRSGD